MTRTKIEMIFKLVPEGDELLAALIPFVQPGFVLDALPGLARETYGSPMGPMVLQSSLIVFNELWWAYVHTLVQKKVAADEIKTEVQGKVMLGIRQKEGFFFVRERQPDGTYEIWLTHDPDRVGQESPEVAMSSMPVASGVGSRMDQCMASMAVVPEGLAMSDKDCSACEDREGCPVRFTKEQVKAGVIPFIAPGSNTEN